MTHFVVPCRKGSKGFPGKNRVLVPILLDGLRKKVRFRTIVTTDDEHVADMFRETPVKVVERPPELAADDTPIRPVIRHAAESMRLYPDDDVVVLYATYPGRTYRDVHRALVWYRRREGRAMLGCVPATTDTPLHLAVRVDADTRLGTRLASDPAPWRRQDCDETVGSSAEGPSGVSELSHAICALRVSALDEVDENLVGADTLYYDIEEPFIDVDAPEDLERWRASL